jgi:uncharacterized membrane protein YjdF
MKFLSSPKAVLAFSAVYLALGALYFLQDLNFEFVIYIVVIVAAFALLFGTLKTTQFPVYILWLISIWGLLHILGGSVPTPDGVLFAYKIYPFIDNGGEFYVLKYDQVVHMYLYGVMAIVFLHVLQKTLKAVGSAWMIFLLAAMASMGVSALNEIMEFLIAISLTRNGVGGYENAMLDLIFNFSGAVIALCIYFIYTKLRKDHVR